MSNSQLPERASLEYLKKLAKDRLQVLRAVILVRSSLTRSSVSRVITASRAGER